MRRRLSLAGLEPRVNSGIDDLDCRTAGGGGGGGGSASPQNM